MWRHIVVESDELDQIYEVAQTMSPAAKAVHGPYWDGWFTGLVGSDCQAQFDECDECGAGPLCVGCGEVGYVRVYQRQTHTIRCIACFGRTVWTYMEEKSRWRPQPGQMPAPPSIC